MPFKCDVFKVHSILPRLGEADRSSYSQAKLGLTGRRREQEGISQKHQFKTGYIENIFTALLCHQTVFSNWELKP